MKKIIVLGLASLMLLATSVPVSAQTCSDWIVYKTGPSICDVEDGCGFLWLKDTRTAVESLRRACLNDEGTEAYIQYGMRNVKLGCCD